MPAQANRIFRWPLARRVSIYLVLSSTTVAGVNLSDLDQGTTAPLYILLFVGIYILSRWIDNRLGQNHPDRADQKTDNNCSQPDPQGFKP